MDNVIGASSLVKARPDVVSSDLADGAALLDLRSSTYFSVNAVGACVWRALERPSSIADLSILVSKEFDVAAEACRADVEAMVEQLNRHGLIEVSSA